MIQLKKQIDKEKLYRKLDDQAHKIYKNCDNATLQAVNFMKGADFMLKHLRQTTKPKKITAMEFMFEYFNESDYKFIIRADKEKKQFDYHDLIDFAEQYNKAKNESGSRKAKE